MRHWVLGKWEIVLYWEYRLRCTREVFVPFKLQHLDVDVKEYNEECLVDSCRSYLACVLFPVLAS